jgi:quercetin dioxygenase-like cupin family protein
MSSRTDVPAATLKAMVLGPGEGRQIPPGDNPFVTIKMERRHSGGTMTAYESSTGPRMAGPPPHTHRTWDEAFYIIEGEMSFLIGDTTHTVAAGGFVFVPHGVLHTFWNAGTSVARQLTIFTPSGIEDFFDEVVPLLAAGVAETAGDFAALTERYDMPTSPTEQVPYSPLD